MFSNEEPDAAQSVQVHDQEEYQLAQLQRHLQVVLQVHVRDQSAQAQDPHQLEQPEELEGEVVVVRVDEEDDDEVEGHRGQQVDPELALEVLHRNLLGVRNVFTRLLVDDGRPEVDHDVEQEEDVDEPVHDVGEDLAAHVGVEGDAVGHVEEVPGGEEHDEEVPANTPLAS